MLKDYANYLFSYFYFIFSGARKAIRCPVSICRRIREKGKSRTSTTIRILVGLLDFSKNCVEK